MLRNLFYNCCPITGAEEVTRDNIAWLLKYADRAFNGRRIVHLKYGRGCEHPENIILLLKPLKSEIQLIHNDPFIGETAGFIDGWKSLKSLRPDELTWYGHTKGASVQNLSPEMRLHSIRQWYRRMYHECLSDPDRIDAAMAGHASAGCFKRLWPIPHYSGAFYWIKHSRLFKLPNWDCSSAKADRLDLFTARPCETERKRFYVETFLAPLFKPADMYDLYSINHRFNPYMRPHRLWRCPAEGCKMFTAEDLGNVLCPRCGGRDSIAVGWPDGLGF